MAANPAPLIALVTDASVDVPASERAGIRWMVVPDTWQHAGVTFTDTGEHSRELTRLAIDVPGLEPAAPDAEAFAGAYEQLAGVPAVISLHSSTAISPAAAAAAEAAVDFPNVDVIETSLTGIGAGLLAARARDLACEGAPADEVASWVRRQGSRTRFAIVPDRFAPAGRQRVLAAVLLSGRPFLSVQGGALSASRRLRSRRATVAAIRSYFADHAPPEAQLHVAVGHGDAAGAVDPLLDIVERMRPSAEVSLVGRVGPRLVQRLGERCVGLAWTVG